MLETEQSNQSLIQQLRRLVKDAIDYLGSVLSLLQARVAEMALSSLVFAALLVVGGLLGFSGLVLAVVALGFWLTAVTGHVGWALLILAGVLGLASFLCVFRALRWLRELKS